MQKYSKYLPTKKFIFKISIAVALVIIIFVVFFKFSGKKNFFTQEKENNTYLKVENQTITELIQNDTDGDGIVDWEEALWGTDKNKKVTFNDTPDATYIENKKKELEIEQNTNTSEVKLTETEKFAREFFSSYSALKSSGQVDDNTINNFSNALGQKIVNPNLIDRYKETDIKINNNNDTPTKLKYYEDIKTSFEKYKTVGIGDELNIVSTKLALNSETGATNSPGEENKLKTIANAYQDFAKTVIEISVPTTLAQYHLQIANSANNTGFSIINMEKIITDPIIGLSGLAQYQKYSEDLIKAVGDLEVNILK